MILNNKISIFYFINLIKLDIIVIILYALISGTLIHLTPFRGVDISLSVSAMIGTLVSLLLAFKTSQSYERWWEARIVWGGIVNDSRSLLRILKQYIPHSHESAEDLERFARRHIIWCYSLGETLRRAGFSAKVSEYLSSHEITSDNVPNFLLNRHSEDLHRFQDIYHLNPNVMVHIDAVIARLNDSMGRCERIKNTVFPKSYSLLIRSIIYVFLTVFPFGLAHMAPAAEISITILIPILFISIERTAMILQDPFENRPTDTPVSKISQTIERNLEELLGLPQAEQEDAMRGYYVL